MPLQERPSGVARGVQVELFAGRLPSVEEGEAHRGRAGGLHPDGLAVVGARFTLT